jgi:CRISPR-associated endonuclease Csn1
MRASGWPDAKLRRCSRQDFEDAEGEGFTNRQLVDTSYIARAARDYLGLLFGGGQAGINAVQVVPGRATAQLRRAWSIGLSRLLHGEEADGPKIRDDHRHHAIDALTVALTSPATVKRLSGWWQMRETQGGKPQFSPPWEGFHAQAKVAVEAIVVSHRVQAKLSGALHEETRLGDTGETRENYRLFVKRKPVAALTAGDVGDSGRGCQEGGSRRDLRRRRQFEEGSCKRDKAAAEGWYTRADYSARADGDTACGGGDAASSR